MNWKRKRDFWRFVCCLIQISLSSWDCCKVLATGKSRYRKWNILPSNEAWNLKQLHGGNKCLKSSRTKILNKERVKLLESQNINSYSELTKMKKCKHRCKKTDKYQLYLGVLVAPVGTALQNYSPVLKFIFCCSLSCKPCSSLMYHQTEIASNKRGFCLRRCCILC